MPLCLARSIRALIGRLSSQRLATKRSPLCELDSSDTSQSSGGTITEAGRKVLPWVATPVTSAAVSTAPPGSNTFNVTPVPPRSCAQIREHASRKAFDGPYGERCLRTIVRSFAEILMILPKPCAIIDGATRRVIRNTPSVLVCEMRRHSSASTRQNGAPGPALGTPALLMRTSILPKAANTSDTILSQLDGSRKSPRALTTCDRAPSESNCANVSSSWTLGPLATMATRAPARTSPRAMARPRPRLPPVTMTARPTIDGWADISADL